jgi:hypothetical protein
LFPEVYEIISNPVLNVQGTLLVGLHIFKAYIQPLQIRKVAAEIRKKYFYFCGTVIESGLGALQGNNLLGIRYCVHILTKIVSY